jgi:hypothetical protein
MGDLSTLLGGADELYGRIGEAGQRAIRDDLAILLLQRPFRAVLFKDAGNFVWIVANCCSPSF